MRKAISIIKATREYVQQAHDRAECRHDTYGEYYIAESQYKIMQETKELLAKMAIIIDEFEKSKS